MTVVSPERREGGNLATIPADLLHAIAQPGGGQVALVVGAGCSLEAPTSLPLAGPLANQAYQQLVLDHVLEDGQCADPYDLAALASLVWEVTNGQSELVKRFPLAAMRQARPNLGYKLLAALMAENAICHVLSLNFDLAAENAAAHLGQTIPSIDAPGDAVPVMPAIVHLHGTANSDPERLTLRMETMDEGWKDQWEQVVAGQVLSAPFILFAGLGSPAPVLTATLDMIQTALGAYKATYQADPGDLEHNTLAQQLNIPGERYIKGGWSEVVDALGTRVAAEHVNALVANGIANLQANGFSQAERDRFTSLVAKLTDISLLAMGKLRAFAKLDLDAIYRRHSPEDDARAAEPMVRLAELAETLGMDLRPTAGGTWQLLSEGRPRAQVLLASGGGVLRLTAVEPLARELCSQIAAESASGPDVVLIGALMPGPPPPEHLDLVADGDSDSLIDGPSKTQIVSANDPDFIQRIGEFLDAA